MQYNKQSKFFILIIAFVLTFQILQGQPYYSVKSDDWNKPETWVTDGCGGTITATSSPSDGDDVYICSNHTITSSALSQSNTNLYLADGAHLNINGGSKTLEINNITFLGTSTNPADAAQITAKSITAANVGGDGNAANPPPYCIFETTTGATIESYNAAGASGDDILLTVNGSLTVSPSASATSYILETLTVNGGDFSITSPALINAALKISGTLNVFDGDFIATSDNLIDIDVTATGILNIDDTDNSNNDGKMILTATAGGQEIYFDNYGSVTISDGYSDSEYVDFVNHNEFTITDGNLLASERGQYSGHYYQFRNKSTGTINVAGNVELTNADGSNVAGQQVYFFEDGSNFSVTSGHLWINGSADPGDTLYIDGNISVEDGEIRSFAHIKVSSTGSISLVDSDPSDATDYLFDLSGDVALINYGDIEAVNLAVGGSGKVINYGDLTVQGAISSGGTIDIINYNNFIVYTLSLSGSDEVINYETMSVGSIDGAPGATVFNGTATDTDASLTFCNNYHQTPGINYGLINYVDESYPSTDPVLDGDFTADGTINLKYTTVEACLSDISGQISTILPIELLLFEAKMNNNNVLLLWETATEKDNDFFSVYKSKNSFDFSKIGEIDGAGNSSTSKQYSFTDKQVESGTTYYRLKQTDFSGTFTYSDIIAIQTEPHPESSVYPIYVKRGNKITIKFNHPDEINNICITSLKGDILYEKDYSQKAKVEITLDYPSGLYKIINRNGDMVSNQTVIVQ